MKLVRWSYNNLHVPMIQDGNGVLFCTANTLASALNVTEQNIRMLLVNKPEEFKGLSVNCVDAKELIKDHKVELGIKRVRNDMKLWSEDEMIMAALLSKSNVGNQFRRDLLKFIKENATGVMFLWKILTRF